MGPKKFNTDKCFFLSQTLSHRCLISSYSETTRKRIQKKKKNLLLFFGIVRELGKGLFFFLRAWVSKCFEVFFIFFLWCVCAGSLGSLDSYKGVANRRKDTVCLACTWNSMSNWKTSSMLHKFMFIFHPILSSTASSFPLLAYIYFLRKLILSLKSSFIFFFHTVNSWHKNLKKNYKWIYFFS